MDEIRGTDRFTTVDRVRGIQGGKWGLNKRDTKVTTGMHKWDEEMTAMDSKNKQEKKYDSLIQTLQSSDKKQRNKYF